MKNDSFEIGSMRDWFEERFRGFAREFYAAGEPLGDTVRYVLEGPGKRVRAVLALLASEAGRASSTTSEVEGDAWQRGLLAAIAVEMIHASSLAHDDLPCMDDDDLRRGRPTAHKRFGEASALLAGDALLVDAFWVLSHREAERLARVRVPHVDGERLLMVEELSLAAGGLGMVRGQSLDIAWTGHARGSTFAARHAALEQIHSGKTGAVLGAACAMGAAAGGASRDVVSELRRFGIRLGVAFQMIDDLLDDSAGTGKTKGKDAAQGKVTWLTLGSRDEVLNAARTETEAAFREIQALGSAGDRIRRFAQSLIDRRT